MLTADHGENENHVEEEEAAGVSVASGNTAQNDKNDVTNGETGSRLLARVIATPDSDGLEARLDWFITEEVSPEDWIGLFWHGKSNFRFGEGFKKSLHMKSKMSERFTKYFKRGEEVSPK